MDHSEGGRSFITSDDPSIFTSRYHFQRLKTHRFGFSSSGAMFILPITPRLLLICYDGDVYTIPEKEGDFLLLSHTADVIAFNEFQYLKSGRNIYFSQWDDRKRIEEEFERINPRRPTSWCEFGVFVADGSNEQGQRYRRATEEERTSEKETLVLMHTLHPEPSKWPSKIKYRHPIRTYSDGSAVGHVRKKEWLEHQAQLAFSQYQ